MFRQAFLRDKNAALLDGRFLPGVDLDNWEVGNHIKECFPMVRVLIRRWRSGEDANNSVLKAPWPVFIANRLTSI
jgi:hypothetical protein